MRDKPYCKAPWIGVSYESTEGCKPCCEWQGLTFKGTYTDYVKSDYLKDFKKLMYNDEMDTRCVECIHNESPELNGKFSRRLWFEKHDITDGLVKLDYRAGNKCNMKCRMCGPGSSSLWEEELIEAHMNFTYTSDTGEVDSNISPSIPLSKIDTSDVYDIDLSSVKLISILGGEPSIDMKVRNFIDYVTNTKLNDAIDIGLTTNATNASSKWFKTLGAVENLYIQMSVDATGDVQDYQRKGGEWDKIKKNMIKYRDTFENVEIHLTVTAINFTVLDIWWDELMSLNIPTDFVVVHEPKHHSLDAIPVSYKEAMVKWLTEWVNVPNTYQEQKLGSGRKKSKQKMVKEAIAILQGSKYNPVWNKEFKKNTLYLDSIRDESIFDIDPRFKEILNA